MYIFGTRGTTRWSLQQKLFYDNDTTSEISTSVDVYNDKRNTIIATVSGPNISSAYVFKIFGNQSFEAGWSLHSRLLPYNTTLDGVTYDDDRAEVRPGITNFSNPSIWGGSILFSAQNEVQIRTRLQNYSCLRIWMSDHFLDGWDTAVLTVVAPDQTNDTFAPHCDQVDPFLVRYCPYDPTDEGIYIIKVFAAIKARFFWEISWRVQVESTGEWYKGDFATKMKFNFNATSSMFSFVEIENEIDFNAPCYRCTTIGLQTWANSQTVGNFALWPLKVHGAPWYISDYEARVLYSTGKVCDQIATYECYQTIPDGLYILRLGGGLFGRLLDFPYARTNWTGCGASGDHRDQLVFRIAESKCTAVQVFRYANRCGRPTAINTAAYSSTFAPTGGGTRAPTQSTFGEPYVKGQMYAETGNGGSGSGGGHAHQGIIGDGKLEFASNRLTDGFDHLKHETRMREALHLTSDEDPANTDRPLTDVLPSETTSSSRATFGFKVEDIMQRHHGNDDADTADADGDVTTASATAAAAAATTADTSSRRLFSSRKRDNKKDSKKSFSDFFMFH